MTISLPDARLLSDDILEALRLRALRGCELGFAEADVAEMLGVSRETVSRWWSAYASGGLDALPRERSGRPLGSGRLLSDEQARRIRELLDGHSPEDLGIAAPLWNRRAVRDLIRKEFGVDLAVRTVGVYLERWGYTTKRPRRRARKQDPDEVRRWLRKTYPAIEERAEQEGAEIYWCDETGAAADAYPGRGYARRGQPAEIAVPDPHLRMNQVSAISNRGEVRFMTYAGAMNAGVFLMFLERLLRGTTGKIYLMVDRLRAHHTAGVEAWVAARRDRLELFLLPRRAPELNPDEYLNNDLKGSLGAAGLPASKADLRSQIQGFMRRLLHLPEHVRSYFEHPCVQYAAVE
ncbi:MAG TPA: IS630 family transposase [Gemmata sp.]|nr:IS630 family transposase [Gemmata sp.]